MLTRIYKLAHMLGSFFQMFKDKTSLFERAIKAYILKFHYIEFKIGGDACSQIFGQCT
jgi:hypothetical protein